MNIILDSLAIEVTRRCNMGCAHCMRGEAQDKDISHTTIDAALRDVSEIFSLSFTGGDVSLNVDAMRYTLQECKRRDICVDGFYTVTNGKSITTDFIIVCAEWYAYCLECTGGDTEACGLALSTDMFHEDIPESNKAYLSTLKFFHEADKTVDWNKTPLVNLGRARRLNSFPKREKCYQNEFDVELLGEDTICFKEATLTVTVDGDILKDCDYEYDSIDDIKIGNVYDEEWAEKSLLAS